MIAALKMTNWTDVETGSESSRGLERRVFERRQMRAKVDGVRLDHTLPALQRPHLNLVLHDVSVGGLCALSDTPVTQGERVSVAVPSNGLSGGWSAYGRVIRCSPSGMGYRLAVEFDRLPAA